MDDNIELIYCIFYGDSILLDKYTANGANLKLVPFSFSILLTREKGVR